MSKYTGKGAVINKPQCRSINTHGMPCVIVEWDKDIRKYKVEFDSGWVGWYKRSELTLDTDKVFG